VTDGRRIACLVKSNPDSIADYQSVEEFPTFEQLEQFFNHAKSPELKLSAQRFQKLPPPKLNVQSKAAQPTNHAAARKAANSAAPPTFAVSADANYLVPPSAKPRRSAASFVGFLACLIVLVLGGAWYAGAFSRPQADAPIQPVAAKPQAEKPATEKPKVETTAKTPVTNAPVTGPTTYGDAPAAPTSARSEKPSKTKSSRGVNSDGTVRLSNNDIAIMQTRPAANPNAQQTQSKVYTQPQQPQQQSAQSGTMQKKRPMVKSPF
jgi:hypothetical protein